MKFAKKLLSVLLVVLMLATMALPAMAATGDLTITITNEDAVEHEYAAYQIFVGDLADTGALSNLEWGSGVDHVALLEVLNKDESDNTPGSNIFPLFTKNGVNAFEGAQTADDVYTVLSGWAYNEADIRKFADVLGNRFLYDDPEDTTNGDKGFKSGTPTDGVYTITIPAPTQPGERNTGYYFIKDVGDLGNSGATDYLLQVVKSISIRPKSSQPTFSKTVNKAKDGTFTKVVSAQVGDEVWFKLEAKLPSSFNYYNAYHLHFRDILPKGLDPIEGSGVMYLKHANNNETPLSRDNNDNVVTVENELDTATGKTTVTINFSDLKKTLDEAQIDIAENDTLIIKYKATVTTDVVYGKGGVDLFGNANAASMEYSNDMNQPADTDDDDVTHGRLEDSASVYVYQTALKKVDSVTGAALSNAQFDLYRNYVGTDNQNTKKYAILEEVTGFPNVYQVTGWQDTAPAANAVHATSAADGMFTIRGLDAISYYLEEVTSPVGYTSMKEPVPVSIAVEYDGHDIKTLSGNIDSVVATSTDKVTGTVSGNVKNAPASALPATGGMGTTIFYIAGAVLLLGSITAFAVKKRGEN